jgi:hypothetical protein
LAGGHIRHPDRIENVILRDTARDAWDPGSMGDRVSYEHVVLSSGAKLWPITANGAIKCQQTPIDQNEDARGKKPLCA